MLARFAPRELGSVDRDCRLPFPKARKQTKTNSQIVGSMNSIIGINCYCLHLSARRIQSPTNFRFNEFNHCRHYRHFDELNHRHQFIIFDEFNHLHKFIIFDQLNHRSQPLFSIL